MKKKILLCLSLALMLTGGLHAKTKPVYRAMRGEVRVAATPGGYEVYSGSYKYGDTIEYVSGGDSKRIRLSFPNGAKGYIDREYLSDNFVETKTELITT